jgi:hypothetical protein
LRKISDRWIPFKILESTRVVKSECRQEEIVEEEDKSQALDPNAGSDHHWIKKNPDIAICKIAM